MIAFGKRSLIRFFSFTATDETRCKMIRSETVNDATSTVLGYMRHEATGFFCSYLLTEESSRFEALMATAKDRNELLAKAGPILLQAKKDSLLPFLAKHLSESFEGIFWSELIQRLLSDTTCRFDNYGTFNRWSNVLSFTSSLLLDVRPGPYTSLDALHSAIDALSRLTMQGLIPSQSDNASLVTVHAETERLLERCLAAMLGYFRPPDSEIFHAWSIAASFATYHAWAYAFPRVLLASPVEIAGVGAFKLVTRVPVRVDFKADDHLLELIAANVPSWEKAA